MVYANRLAALWLLAASAAAEPHFPDVAKEAGLVHAFYCGGDERKTYILETLGGGVALLDYDRDGWLDVFFVTGDRFEGFEDGRRPTNRLYRNLQDGTFEDVTSPTGMTAHGWGQGVCAGDIDNDGWTDLFVTYWGRNRLYRNRQGKGFEERSVASGLGADERWSTGCAFLDYDRDGDLDLYVANYVDFDPATAPKPGESANCRWMGQPVMCGPTGLAGQRDQLFRNSGDGTFEDVSKESGIDAAGPRYSLSVTTLDYDGDSLPDIYVAVDSQPSLLWRNQGDGTFEDVGEISGSAYSEDGRPQAGMGSAAGDFDRDGRLDLVKTNFIGDTANLYRNAGDGLFEDWVYKTGMGRNTQYMGWGAAFLDFDHDSWVDILMVNGHVYPELEGLVSNNLYRQKRLLYRNESGRRVEDVSDAAGIRDRHSSRGLAVGDYDNDGDLDVFINNMNEPPSLLRNDSQKLGGALTIELRGTASNRDGIGARVEVRTADGSQTQEVRSGSSFLSNSDTKLHFGLGRSAAADTIRIEWPSGAVENLRNVSAAQRIVVVESEGVSRSTPFVDRELK